MLGVLGRLDILDRLEVLDNTKYYAGDKENN